MDILVRYSIEVWEILLEASPYVLFGFFVAGLLKAFMPADFVARHLGRGTYAPVFKAAMFGVPLPLCSCGVIPAAAGLRQQGASKGATTSFMISTPETGVDSIAITYALLDPVMTVIRPVAAFVSAITAGLLVDALPGSEQKEKEKAKQAVPASAAFDMTPLTTVQNPIHSHAPSLAAESGESCGCCSSHGKQPTSVREKFVSGMAFAFGELVADIGKWLLVGILLAGVISTFLPVHFIEQYIGNGLFGMILMVLVGIPMYVCATASTPIAAALALKGLSPGAALVFLLAGPATNAATITVVAKTLGKRVAVIYVSSIAVVSVLLGLAVNSIYGTLGLNIASWVSAVETHEHGIVSVLATLLLLGLILKQLARQFTAGGEAHLSGG